MDCFIELFRAWGLTGAMPSSRHMSSNSSKQMLPSWLMSNRSKKTFMASWSTVLYALRILRDGASGLEREPGMSIAGMSPRGSPVSMRCFRSAATWSTNCSVVRPVGPERSRVPLPSRNALYTASRQCTTYLSTIALFDVSRRAACSMAPNRATTMPNGFMEVSSPRRCACQRSATVPWEASNSLMSEPSALLPTRLEVMKPGLRCTCATSSVSMSPS
mmetsp:Transcript_49263/g.145458  ORF Transcript_49263/g.145458 Transcript_49263/m.145458 type:complete len:218 (-) Transcript_49263:996-1649(-)